MRGDRYDDYARQLRREETARLFGVLAAAVANMWGRAMTALRRQARSALRLRRAE